MSYSKLPTRTSYDLNSAADINQLTENIDVVKSEAIPIDPYLVYATVSSATTIEIDWTEASKYYALLDIATTTFTFVDPDYPTTLILVLEQDNTGGRAAILPTETLWASAYAELTTASNSIDIINMFFDGETYYATMLNDFKVLP